MTRLLFITALALAPLAAALAHGDAKNAPATAGKSISTEEKPFGREGDPKKATRTINVDMSDKMRYAPSSILVNQGDTVRFVLKNSGRIMHEFVLGTMQELKDHAEVMKKHPGMEHAEPYMAHVPPGRTERVVWQFTQAGEFHYGCLIPGHFEAGMIGRINVSAR